MNKSLALKNKIYLFFSLISLFFVFLYLLYFLINGERGLISYYKINNYMYELQKTLSDIETKNIYLSNRIKRLETNTIDLDYLDEQLRNTTGFIENNEVIIKFN
tara:strand:+ start:99 stop:410 length:312 start_codon:yes stop_codon:yes gene_type:complete